MAEATLHTAEKVAKLAVKSAHFLGELKKNVEDLTTELNTIASVLKNSDVMIDKEGDFDEWVIQLRQLAFKSEDVIEVFINNSTPCEGCNIFQLIMGGICQVITLNKLKREINDINLKLEELKKRKDNGNLIKIRSASQGTSETSSFNRYRVVEDEMPPSASDEDDDVDKMVGFEDEANNLWSSLTKEEHLGELHALAIWAQAGAGKTALAWDIYKRCCVGSHFNCVAWVSVSPKYDEKDIWQLILKQVKKHTGEESNDHGVATVAAVRTALQGKDYLVILDDLWREQDWEKISKAFPKSPKRKCKVLVTTRIDNVACYVNPSAKPFQLRLLNEEESLELFFKTVFRRSLRNIPEDILSDEHMKSLAAELVSKCERLPIVIVLLGGMLSSREKNVDEWKDMLEKVQSDLRESRVFQTVFALSYNDLTYIAKSSFLYVGLYPEDSLIDCDKLIRLWVAEGFFEEKDERTLMEDYGRKCLEDLIRRSMIQVVETKLNGRVAQTCRTHDLISFTAKEEANKAKFSSICRKKELESAETSIRRIAVHTDEFFHIDGKSFPTPLQSSLTSSSFDPSVIEANDISYFQEEANQLASLLMEEEPLGQLDVVSITAISGAGKTALASKIYNRNDVRSHFACRAWVNPFRGFFREFDAKNMMKSILQQVTALTDAESKVDDEYELQKMVRHHLKEKSSYLIIIEDIYRIEDWDIVERILPTQSQQKCRVLLTSRFKEVARYASKKVSFELRPLNRNESLQLFLETLWKRSVDDIPKGKGGLSEELVKMAVELLELCFGLPLAIQLLAGHLSVTRNDVSRWSYVLGRIRLWPESAIVQNLMGVCYADLQPDYLRYCLVLCLLLPEGTEIHCDTLTRLWVAKGFLKPSRDGKIVEDVARNCLEKLIQRNLIQVITKRRFRGSAPVTCRVHGLIRDYCKRHANNEDLPFSLENTDLESMEGNRPAALPPALGKVSQAHEEEATSSTTHHLLLQPPKSFNLINALLPVLNLFNFPNHVHSLMCFSKNLQIRFEAFPLLRVLDLEGAENIHQLPSEIGNLTLLRYLGLRGTRVQQIPPWIANLLNLQTLDAPASKIPIVVLKLKQLRHLFAHSFLAPRNTCSPDSSSSSSSQSLCIGVLEQLQTLEVDLDNWKIHDLHRCTKLRVLKLRLHGAADTLRSIIDFMKRLKFLRLKEAGKSSSSKSLPLPSLKTHSQLEEIVVEGTIIEANDFPPYLSHLWVENSIKHGVNPLFRVQQLKNLKRLSLRLFMGKLSSDAVQMTCFKGGFPKLEYLYIILDFKLENWIVEEGAFPILKVLHIEGEETLGKLPDGLKCVTTLKELIITRGYDVARSLKHGGEEWDKVKHIRPSIVYLNQSSMRP